jgi:hypothetical protein
MGEKWNTEKLGCSARCVSVWLIEAEGTRLAPGTWGLWALNPRHRGWTLCELGDPWYISVLKATSLFLKLV